MHLKKNIPARRIVSVVDVKYLKAKAKPSVSKVTWVSSGSFIAAHIKSAIDLVAGERKS